MPPCPIRLPDLCSASRQAMTSSSAKPADIPAKRMVSAAASHSPGPCRAQLRQLSPLGHASGNAQNPATDHTAKPAKPTSTAQATSTPAPAPTARCRPCRRPRPPATNTRRPSAATTRSASRQPKRPAPTRPSCNRAAAEACPRNVRSGSLIHLVICTARVGGVDGPRISATSTTDIA